MPIDRILEISRLRPLVLEKQTMTFYVKQESANKQTNKQTDKRSNGQTDATNFIISLLRGQ